MQKQPQPRRRNEVKKKRYFPAHLLITPEGTKLFHCLGDNEHKVQETKNIQGTFSFWGRGSLKKGDWRLIYREQGDSHRTKRKNKFHIKNF